MYLTSFIHRDALFDIAERWLCGRLEPDDGLRITQILICDDFVLGETLERFARLLLEITYRCPFQQRRISFKGELRDAICRNVRDRNPRVARKEERLSENRAANLPAELIGRPMLQHAATEGCQIRDAILLAERLPRQIQGQKRVPDEIPAAGAVISRGKTSARSN